MRDRRWIIGLILALIAAISWFWQGRQEQSPEALRTAAQKLPDSFFETMEIVSHNEDGAPVSRLQAAEATHYPEEDVVHLKQVLARSLDPDSNWELRSAAGKLWPENNRLLASEGAKLSQTGGEGTPIVIESESLLLDSGNETVTTDDLVVISQGRSAIRGKGLIGSLRDNRIVISSSVEARYADDQ